MSDIGDSIAKLRKDKGATQEELAAAAGVSAQAVSKWECGGAPDTELLPKIADYFAVPIDALFGRTAGKYRDLKAEVRALLAGLPEEERVAEAMEWCWTLERGIFGELFEERFPIGNTIDQALAENRDAFARMARATPGADPEPPVYSSVRNTQGFARMSLSKNPRYFLLMRNPEDGWESALGAIGEYQELFAALGDPDVFRALWRLFWEPAQMFCRGRSRRVSRRRWTSRRSKPRAPSRSCGGTGFSPICPRCPSLPRRTAA